MYTNWEANRPYIPATLPLVRGPVGPLLNLPSFLVRVSARNVWLGRHASIARDAHFAEGTFTSGDTVIETLVLFGISF